MSNPNDGGPAFPALTTEGFPRCFDCMTLRDYFAANVKLEDVDEGSFFQASALMGENPPKWSTPDDHEGNLKCIKWWAEADARLRYIVSDAMLAAREVKQ